MLVREQTRTLSKGRRVAQTGLSNPSWSGGGALVFWFQSSGWVRVKFLSWQMPKALRRYAGYAARYCIVCGIMTAVGCDAAGLLSPISDLKKAARQHVAEGSRPLSMRGSGWLLR